MSEVTREVMRKMDDETSLPDDAFARHMEAVVQQLVALRRQLTECLTMGEVFRTDADKAVVRGIAYNLLGAENHIRLAMAPLTPRYAVDKTEESPRQPPTDRDLAYQG